MFYFNLNNIKSGTDILILTKANYATLKFFYSDSFDITWNVRPGIRQSRLPSGTSLLDKDGIFANSASSKLLERAHGILTSVLISNMDSSFMSGLQFLTAEDEEK
jgi:hypothetical protein